MAIYKTATGWSIKVMKDGFRFSDFVKGLEHYKDAEAIELSAKADMARGLRPSGGQLKHGTTLTLQYAFDEVWDMSWAKQSKGSFSIGIACQGTSLTSVKCTGLRLWIPRQLMITLRCLGRKETSQRQSIIN
jgi:hypothetical protein